MKEISEETKQEISLGLQDYLTRLMNNDPSLTKIDLENNNITDTGAKDLAEALKVNQTLTEIYLSVNKITDTGAKDLAEALKINQSLTTIHLYGNEITDTGTKDIAEALKVNRSLTRIELGVNNITAPGAKDIAEALKVNRSLTRIELGTNNITATGAKDIAEALKVNRSLTKIYLWHNNITDTGVKDIAEALKVNQTLTEIILSGNDITAPGAKDIAEALKVNRSLTEIDLTDNNITATGAKYLIEALKFNKTLTKIALSGNDISNKLLSQITDSLNRNQEFQKLLIPATTHHNSGNSYYSQGNPVAALEEFQKALIIRETYLPSSHPDLIASSDGIIKAFLSIDDVNWTNATIILTANGTTELMLAAMRGDLEKIKLLLTLPANKAGINAINKSGSTALHYAVKTLNLNLIKLLILNGADVTIKNISGQSIMDLANIECQNLKPRNFEFRSRLEKLIKDCKKEIAYQKLSTQTTTSNTKQRHVAEVKLELIDQIKDLSEEDVLDKTKKEIWNYLNQIGVQKSSTVVQILKDFLEIKALDPSNLLRPKESWSNSDKLLRKQAENALQNITALIKEMDKISSEINKKIPEQDVKKFLADKLNIIKKHYEDYVLAYKSSNAEDRDYRISPKPYIHSTNPEIGRRYLKRSTAMGVFPDSYSVQNSDSESNGASSSNSGLEQKSSPTSQSPTPNATKETSGSHPVVKLSDSQGRLLHLKESPSAPGVEFMVCSLDDIISGRGTAPTELLKITNPKGNSACYIASKTIVGSELSHVVEHHPEVLSMIDPQNFSEMMVLGLLTDPQDGKLDNYMAEVTFEADEEVKGENKEERKPKVKSIRIVGIDNDISFADPIIREHQGQRKGQHFVNVKNGLYFFPQMKGAINDKFKKRFLETSPELTIINWLSALDKKNQEYQSLLDNNVITKKEYDDLKLPIQVRNKTIEVLYKKLKQIKQIFEDDQYKNITHQELFQLVEKDLYFYYRHISKTREEQVAKGEITLQESIHESLNDIYKAAAPSYELVHELEQGIMSGNSITFSRIAYQNAAVWDFVDKRTISIKTAAEEFTGLIDYSDFNQEGEKLLENQILSKLPFITSLTIQNSEFLNTDRLLELLAPSPLKPRITHLTIKGMGEIKIGDLKTILNLNRDLKISIDTNHKIIPLKELMELADAQPDRINLIASGKIIPNNQGKHSSEEQLKNLIEKNIFSEVLYDHIIAKDNLNLKHHSFPKGTALDSMNFLHIAAAGNNENSIRITNYLIEKGVDPVKADNGGVTPLYIAVRNSNKQMAEHLLERLKEKCEGGEIGENKEREKGQKESEATPNLKDLLNLKDKKGHTILDKAMEANKKKPSPDAAEIVILLINHGARQGATANTLIVPGQSTDAGLSPNSNSSPSPSPTNATVTKRLSEKEKGEVREV